MMRGSILSYFEMCQREGTSLQRGMNFPLGGRHSVILMSVRPNSPYRDRIENDGAVLIYEGHDVPRTSSTPDPKSLDQEKYLASGTPTENGKFFKAAKHHAKSSKHADIVRVYEKLRKGVWSDNGDFRLADAWQEDDGVRHVFKFKLEVLEGPEAPSSDMGDASSLRSPGRIIPSSVKLEVYRRDGGHCVICAENEIHFDHILPFSKGGTSRTADNVQLLCARHNLAKSARIE